MNSHSTSTSDEGPCNDPLLLTLEGLFILFHLTDGRSDKRAHGDRMDFTQMCDCQAFFVNNELSNALTLRRLMSYIYGAPFLMFLDHTQRRSTVGRTPLDE